MTRTNHGSRAASLLLAAFAAFAGPAAAQQDTTASAAAAPPATARPDSLPADSLPPPPTGRGAEPRMTARSETVTVRGIRRDLGRQGMLSRDIQPTSVVTTETMQCRNAGNLVQAVAGEPGVDVLTGCSMCGFKQVEVDGLGPERTTVLVDGLPLYSTISGFYGLDGLATAGLANIEISRGPGASLLAPAAIGGAMDVRLTDPVKPFVQADAAVGNDGFRRLSFSGGTALPDGSLGIAVAGHSYAQGQVDADGNGLTESPSLRDESAMVRLDGSLLGLWNWNARALHARSEVCGGRAGERCWEAAADTGAASFQDGDVRKAYAGSVSATTEWVATTRDEAAGSLSFSSDDLGIWQLRGGWAASRQNSLYEDHADYGNRDELATGDLRWSRSAGSHTATIGMDGSWEGMKSNSHHYYEDLGMARDDFDALFLGAYAQDVWNLGPQRDLSVAVRLDKARVDWTAKGSDPQIDDLLASPRASLRWRFTDGLVGRLSAGQGWRAPLTFFESDHGLLDDGFAIDVDRLERAWGVGSSLAWERETWNLQAGAYGTVLKNLAYIDGDGDVPTLRNDPSELSFLIVDFEAGFQPWKWARIGAGIQHQWIPDRYKAHAALAAVETRLDGDLKLSAGPVSFSLDATWTAPRDLSPYGYGNQYDVFDASTGQASSPKRSRAPGFAVVDAQASLRLHGPLEAYAGAQNLFDYTQAASAHDSPLFWDAQGGYDVSHIWGPLRGRQLYAGLRWKE